MRNYVQPGDTLTLPAPANVSSGDLVIVGSIYGVAAEDAASGADVDLSVKGVFSLPKVSGTAFAVGDAIYWDATAKNTTKTTTSNTKIGVAVAAAASADTTASVRLNGSF